MNGRLASPKKVLTLVVSLTAVIVIAILAIVAAGLMREESPARQQGRDVTVADVQPAQTPAAGDSEFKPLSGAETVEKMRGFSMQMQPMGRSDGRPDPESTRRDEIMAELRHLDKEAVPAIARALKDPDVQMRRNAALVLIELAADWPGKPIVDIRAAIPSLIIATEDPDHHVRAWAAHAFAAIGPDAKEAVPAVTRLLKDPEEGPRNTGAIALGAIGAAAKTAIPALREALEDPKEDVRRFAKAAIEAIEEACEQERQGAE